MASLEVKKFNVHGRLAATWTGHVLEHNPDFLLIEARWTRSQRLDLGYVVFEYGDIFLEYYLPNRWFSIWQIGGTYQRPLKGWYCNVCTPFVLEGGTLTFTDLVLDVFVHPDGRYEVLDEDELVELEEHGAEQLTAGRAAEARAAVGEIVAMVEEQRFPFIVHPTGSLPARR